jgi:hypothetical protein
MIKFLESNFDKESGISMVKIATECGFFYGYAFLNPEDRKYESGYLGCEIAEMRAIREYYERKIHFLNTRILTLEDIAKDIRVNKQFDSEHFEYQIILKRLKQAKDQKQEFKEIIKDIDAAIEVKLDARVALVDRLEKKNQDNE